MAAFYNQPNSQNATPKRAYIGGIKDENYYYDRHHTIGTHPNQQQTGAPFTLTNVTPIHGVAPTSASVGGGHAMGDLNLQYPTPREVGGTRSSVQYPRATTPVKTAMTPVGGGKRLPVPGSEQTPMMPSGVAGTPPGSKRPRPTQQQQFYHQPLLPQQNMGTQNNFSPNQFDQKLLKLQLLFDEVVQDVRTTSATQHRDYELALREVQREAAILREVKAQQEHRHQNPGQASVPAGAGSASFLGAPPAPQQPQPVPLPPQQQRAEAAGPSGPQFSPYRSKGPRWITLWPGTHRAASGQRVLLSPNLNWEQVVEKCAAETACQPTPRLIYTPDGRSIHSSEGLVAGADYIILPSGCRYNEESVPTLLLEKLVNGATQSVVNAASGGKGRDGTDLYY